MSFSTAITHFHERLIFMLTASRSQTNYERCAPNRSRIVISHLQTTSCTQSQSLSRIRSDHIFTMHPTPIFKIDLLARTSYIVSIRYAVHSNLNHRCRTKPQTLQPVRRSRGRSKIPRKETQSCGTSVRTISQRP
jgi:hypothetical protein